MEYKNILSSQLLSETNVNFLVNTILENFKISSKAIMKCTNIITNNLIKYLNNIDRYPENNNELIEAINFLNKKCYDDFTLYLLTKYPNTNLLRSTPQVQSNEQSQNIEPLINSKKSSPQYQEMIIITEKEKNELLKQHEINQFKQTGTKTISDDFLSYLTDPIVLQMFSTMINQVKFGSLTCSIGDGVGQQNTIQHKNNLLIFDDILDANQTQELIAKISQETINNMTFAPTIIQKINNTDTDKIIDGSKSTNTKSDAITKNIKTDTASETIHVNFDLAKLTNSALPFVEKKLNELVSLKNKYLSENNKEMVRQIDDEKEKIINAIKIYKKELKKEAKESDNKINGIFMSNHKRANNEKNVEFLDLKIDPTDDYNDLKNIIINFDVENKITDITLVEYYLPFNDNNVTRFNNKFVIYFNNKMNRIIIPPGKYEINILLGYIKDQINFLEFTCDENKIITVKNTMNTKFDLMLDSDTIFPLLGFIGKVDNYKEKLQFVASQPYNIDCNEKLFFNLSGSSMDPLLMEFDKQIIINKSLKKSTAGVSIKQIVLNFCNAVEQYYDFILPFKICFKITYL